MRTLTLRREKEIGDATIGRMVTPEGTTLCVTLEELWHDVNGDGLGDKGKSRIPAGTYTCQRYKSPSHGGAELFQITKVPGRDYILIHAGNTTKDTLGCVLVGTAVVAGQPAISESRKALEKFMAYFKADKEFSLTVVDP